MLAWHTLTIMKMKTWHSVSKRLPTPAVYCINMNEDIDEIDLNRLLHTHLKKYFILNRGLNYIVFNIYLSLHVDVVSNDPGTVKHVLARSKCPAHLGLQTQRGTDTQTYRGTDS